MPFIIGFLSRFFVTFFSRLSAWAVGLVSTLAGPLATAFLKLTSNLSKLLLGAAAIAAAIMVFSAAVDLALKAISSAAPDDLLEIGRMILPSNMSVCISLLVFLRIKSLILFWVVRLTEKLERT